MCKSPIGELAVGTSQGLGPGGRSSEEVSTASRAGLLEKTFQKQPQGFEKGRQEREGGFLGSRWAVPGSGKGGPGDGPSSVS